YRTGKTNKNAKCLSETQVICVRIRDAVLLLPPAAVLCTALIVVNNLANPTVSGKYVWFAVVLPLSILSVIAASLIKRKAVRLSAADILLTAFCLWGICRTYCLTGGFSLRLQLFFMAWVFYVVCRILFSQMRCAETGILLGLASIGLVEAVWGTGQLHGYYFSQHALFRTTGSFYNSGPYGGFLAIALPAAVYFVLNDFQAFKRKPERKLLRRYFRWIICAAALLAIVSVLPSTMSRAAWIAGFSGSALIILCRYLPRIKRNLSACFVRHKPVIWIASALFVLIAGASLAGIYSLKKDSADGRALIWKISSGIIADHPMGAGIGRFASHYGEYQIRYFSNSRAADSKEGVVAGNPEYAFNKYIQIAVEQGILSFVIFALLSLSALYTGIRRGKHAATGALLSLLVFAFFSYPFSLLPFLIAFAALLALCITGGSSSEVACINIPPLVSVALSGLLLIAVSFLLYRQYPVYKAYREWKTMKMMNNVGMDKETVPIYQKNYIYLRHESSFLFEYAQCLNRLGRHKESNQALTEMKNISCDPMVHNSNGTEFPVYEKIQRSRNVFSEINTNGSQPPLPSLPANETLQRAGRYPENEEDNCYFAAKKAQSRFAGCPGHERRSEEAPEINSLLLSSEKGDGEQQNTEE
ncbi:MAG: O-antigen ligase family protein, partial [Dysgonamonadaceae bacterium]